MKALKCVGCWHMVTRHGPKGCRALRIVSSGDYGSRNVLCGCKLKAGQAKKGARV